MMNYEEVGSLAKFMIEAIAANPENRTETGVNWDFVSADVYMDYTGKFDDDMIEAAIDLILEAASDEKSEIILH